MGRVYYNKLIRDRIPDKIRSRGESCEVRELADPEEFEQELLKKIAEEANGLAKARSKAEFLAEYADLMAVLEEAVRALSITEAEITEVRARNDDAKGGFRNKLFLHWSSDGSYRSNESAQGTGGK